MTKWVYSIRPKHMKIKSRVFHESDDGSEVYVNHTCEVHEPEDDSPISTGILSPDGNDIIRFPVRNAIGFGHAYEDE